MNDRENENYILSEQKCNRDAKFFRIKFKRAKINLDVFTCLNVGLSQAQRGLYRGVSQTRLKFFIPQTSLSFGK